MPPTARPGVGPVVEAGADDGGGNAEDLPSLAVIGLLGFVGFLAEGAMINWSGVLLRGPDHASLVVAPLALTGFSVGMIAGRASGDRFIERHGHVAVASVAAAVAACGMGIAAGVPVAIAAIAGCAVAGAGLSVLVPIAFALAARTPGPSRVHVITRLTIVAYAALFVGPPMVGLAATTIGLRGALIAVGATTLAVIPAIRR